MKNKNGAIKFWRAWLYNQMTFSTRHYVIKIYYLAYFDISYLFRIIHLVCIAPTCRRKFHKVFYTKHNFKSGPVILTFSQITKIQFPYNASSFPFINSALIQLIQQLCIDLSPKLTIKKSILWTQMKIKILYQTQPISLKLTFFYTHHLKELSLVSSLTERHACGCKETWLILICGRKAQSNVCGKCVRRM